MAEPSVRQALIGLGLALFAVYLASLAIEPSKEDAINARFSSSSSANSAAGPAGQQAAGALVAHAWISSNRVDSSDKLRLRITFDNHTGAPVEGLQIVYFKAPGFEVPDCWNKNKCMQGTGETPLPAVLKAGASTTAWIDLQPSISQGRYAIVAPFTWSQKDKGVSTDAISAGPIEITQPWRETVSAIGKPLGTLIQGLALPAVLILLGWYFHEMEKSHEERRQVWNNLLPGLLEHAQKFYMPINRGVKNLLASAQKSRSSQDPADQRTFLYWMLITNRRFRGLRESLGGFHFKDRSGEKIAAQAWTAFNYHLENRFGLKRRDEALDFLDPNESFSKFEERFTHWQTRTLFLSLEQDAISWLKGDAKGRFAQVEPLLVVLRCVMEYEINRPFSNWYDSEEEFARIECTAAKQQLPRQPEDIIGRLHAQLGDYLRGFKQA